MTDAQRDAPRPKTKLVAVWHVETARDWGFPEVFALSSYTEADKLRDLMMKLGDHHCITITGPHQHRVPV